MQQLRWVWCVALVSSCAAPEVADAGAEAVDASVDAGVDAGVSENGWCAHLASGPAVAGDFTTSLSALHAHVRYFSAEPRARAVDDALVAALRTAVEVEPSVLWPYGRSLESVCVGAPDDRPLPTASVERRGSVAVIRPGVGALSVLSEVAAWALDLRDLSDAPGLAEAVQRAMAEVLAMPLTAVKRRVLVRQGLTDEASFPMSIYQASLLEQVLAAPRPRAAMARPLAVLTSERMPPAAAEAAVALRAAGLAFILGAPVETRVAEAHRRATFSFASVAVRDADLLAGVDRLPDIIPADGTEAMLETLTSLGTPTPLAGPATRQAIVKSDDFNDIHEGPLDVPTLRAALIAAHGAAKLFFPYFSVLPDDTDRRLAETLALASSGTSSRLRARDVLRRFVNVLHDGHGWVFDFGSAQGGVSLPLVFEQVEQRIVVSRSYVSTVSRGDVVERIDGVDAATWLERQLTLTYGATPTHRFFTALGELQSSAVPVSLGLLSPAGTSRTVVVRPVQLPDADLYAGTVRPHGWLTDLGAPDVYYFNLDGRHVESDADLEARLMQASTARGLVLDLRGHPANGGATWDPYTFLRRIIRSDFDTPRYSVPSYLGIDELTQVHPYEEHFTPLAPPAFAGRVVLVIDGRAVSFAEDFAMMLVGAHRVTVVGQQSAGTTGSVTGMQLPGSLSMFFTGMAARWPDGRDFFATGIVPDVVVTPALRTYATGPDAFLVAAVAALP